MIDCLKIHRELSSRACDACRKKHASDGVALIGAFAVDRWRTLPNFRRRADQSMSNGVAAQILGEAPQERASASIAIGFRFRKPKKATENAENPAPLTLASRLLEQTRSLRATFLVMAGLVPAIHVDPRVKPAGDE